MNDKTLSNQISYIAQHQNQGFWRQFYKNINHEPGNFLSSGDIWNCSYFVHFALNKYHLKIAQVWDAEISWITCNILSSGQCMVFFHNPYQSWVYFLPFWIITIDDLKNYIPLMHFFQVKLTQALKRLYILKFIRYCSNACPVFRTDNLIEI